MSRSYDPKEKPRVGFVIRFRGPGLREPFSGCLQDPGAFYEEKVWGPGGHPTLLSCHVWPYKETGRRLEVTERARMTTWSANPEREVLYYVCWGECSDEIIVFDSAENAEVIARRLRTQAKFYHPGWDWEYEVKAVGRVRPRGTKWHLWPTPTSDDTADDTADVRIEMWGKHKFQDRGIYVHKHGRWVKTASLPDELICDICGHVPLTCPVPVVGGNAYCRECLQTFRTAERAA